MKMKGLGKLMCLGTNILKIGSNMNQARVSRATRFSARSRFENAPRTPRNQAGSHCALPEHRVSAARHSGGTVFPYWLCGSRSWPSWPRQARPEDHADLLCTAIRSDLGDSAQLLNLREETPLAAKLGPSDCNTWSCSCSCSRAPPSKAAEPLCCSRTTADGLLLHSACTSPACAPISCGAPPRSAIEAAPACIH